MKKVKYLAAMLAVVSFMSCKDDEGSSNQTMDHKKFMMQAASSSKFEVATGKLATQKASHDSVAIYGDMMVREHTQANTELMALATSKNVTLPDTFDTQKQARYSALNQLEGVPFDKQFSDEMVASHEMVVQKFDSASKYANDADVRAWAGQKLPQLQMHLEHARHLDAITNKL